MLQEAKEWFIYIGYDIDQMIADGDMDEQMIIATYKQYLLGNGSC